MSGHKVSVAERAEFSRVAKEMYAAGANTDAHLLSAVAAKAESPESQYNRAVRAFGSWVLHHPPASKNPGRRRARARARPRARQPRSPIPLNPAPARYYAVFKVGRHRNRVEFNARDDAAAVRYATGLLRHKHGGDCVSVQRVTVQKKK